MRKAALKTYLYEIIFILVFKLSMDIFLRVSYFVYFLLWILSVIIMIYLFPYLILSLIGNHYLFVKLDPEKYILIVEKTYKIFKINIMKDFNRINLSVCYWLLNEKEKALKYLNEIKITRLTLPIIKHCYYRNLMEYKYFMGEKEEARKIFDENFRKSGEKLEIGIMLDYENNPQQKIIIDFSQLSTQSVRNIKPPAMRVRKRKFATKYTFHYNRVVQATINERKVFIWLNLKSY